MSNKEMTCNHLTTTLDQSPYKYSRGGRTSTERPRRTGCPAFAEHDSGGDVSQRPRGTICPSLAIHRPRRDRGRRECRVPLHPQPRVRQKRKEMHTSHHRYNRTHSGISLRDVGRLIPCSPRRTGLVSHRRLAGVYLRKLDTSVGVPGPHGFVERLTRASSLRAINVHRNPPHVS